MKGYGILAAALIVALTPVLRGAAQTSAYGGANDFNAYCASCHGSSAKGDGPIANSFRKKPADLTKLSLRNNGVYPADMVFKTIDGRTPVSGHGGPDMPTWGDVFVKSSESSNAEAVRQRIDSLVKYLETLQDKK
ncbi:MAG: cytochrome c [Acidobacteriia bacterium]|nr:cytochrome c [Terriglobia bacterium]